MIDKDVVIVPIGFGLFLTYGIVKQDLFTLTIVSFFIYISFVMSLHLVHIKNKQLEIK